MATANAVIAFNACAAVVSAMNDAEHEQFLNELRHSKKRPPGALVSSLLGYKSHVQFQVLGMLRYGLVLQVRVGSAHSR